MTYIPDALYAHQGYMILYFFDQKIGRESILSIVVSRRSEGDQILALLNLG